MRSVLREKSQDFFEILRYDRRDWMVFWDRYISENEEFMAGYCPALGLDREAVRAHLYAFERRFLDRLKMENETIRRIKGKTVNALSAIQGQLKLNQADFTVYMAGGLGLREFIAYRESRGFVVLMDIIALKKLDHLARMPELTVACVQQIRKVLDSPEGGSVWVSKELAS